MEGTPTLERNSLETLRAEVRGLVSARGDEAYDAERAGWNLIIDHSPDVIVSAESEADVQAAVRFAAAIGMPVAVQSTGHGQFRTAHGGMLIRTSRLKKVEIDVENRSATIGAGVKWHDVIHAAAAHGLAPLSGSSPDVGVVGYLLGGGFSLFVRKYGLGIDHLKRMRVVLADGTATDVSANENADLFWALCGGGGAIGVVTEVEVALFPHAMVYGGAFMFPAERRAEIFAAYARWTAELPNDVSTGITLATFPPVPFVPEFLRGRSMVMIASCMPNDDLAAAEAWVKPMRDLGPEFDFTGEMPYTESSKIYNEPEDPLPAKVRGVLLSDFTEETAKALVEAIGEPAQSPNLIIQMRHLGGAIGHRDESAAVVGDRRRAKYLLFTLGIPVGPNTPEAMAAHSESVYAQIAPWIMSRGPLNFLGEQDVSADFIREVFGEEGYRRLVEVKKTVDPQNLFRNAGIGICLSEG